MCCQISSRSIKTKSSLNKTTRTHLVELTCRHTYIIIHTYHPGHFSFCNKWPTKSFTHFPGWITSPLPTCHRAQTSSPDLPWWFGWWWMVRKQKKMLLCRYWKWGIFSPTKTMLNLSNLRCLNKPMVVWQPRVGPPHTAARTGPNSSHLGHQPRNFNCVCIAIYGAGLLKQNVCF